MNLLGLAPLLPVNLAFMMTRKRESELAMEEKMQKLVKACEKYADNTALRASVQFIPWVGGALDTLLAGKGAKVQRERLEHFLLELSNRLQRVESVPEIDEQALYDLSIDAMEKSIRTRLKEKRALYANVIARHVIQQTAIDDSEMALGIIAEFDLIHFEILREALQAPTCGEPFSGLRVIAIGKQPSNISGVNQPLVLQNRLRNRQPEMIQYAAAELVARGLLYDEGIGRADVKSMEYLVATGTAHWVNQWLSESGSK